MITAEQFKEKLRSLIRLEEKFGALVYFAMKGEDELILKKANIKEDVLKSIAIGYLDSLSKEVERFEQDDQMAVLNLSDRDERANAIYRYDLPDEEPSFFALMKEPVSNPPIDYSGDKMFGFEKDSFSMIDFFVIVLGEGDNQIVVYRNNFNVNLLKQSHGRFMLTKSGTQIGKVDDDILRMDSQIDCMKIDDDFFIVNLKNLDSNKDFAKLIQTRAGKAIDLIKDLPYIDSVDGLRSRLEDLTFARRLMRAVDNSPVTNLDAESVLGFVRNHSTLSRVLKIKGDKLDLKSKRAQSAFVSLLNDDFLYSKLTNRDYESSAKGPVSN